MTTFTTTIIPILYKIPLSLAPFHRIRRWDNMEEIHRAVMSLFPPDLPGGERERRATASILYRIEPKPTPHLLLQTVTPILDSDLNEVTESDLSGLFNALTPGMPVAFRARVNAVRKTGNAKKAVHLDDLNAKLCDPERENGLLYRAVTDINLLDVHHSVLTKGKIPLNTFRVTGTARVDNLDVLTEKIIHGVGPARAYGCGLLSIIPG